MNDMQSYNRQVIAEFRALRAQGQVEERPRLLLTTTGARSGQHSTTPLMYIPINIPVSIPASEHDGDRLLVIASNAGASRHPDWYHNLVAHPTVTVEVKQETYEATAVVPTGAEREQLWNMVIARYPFFAEHQAKTSRQIPIVVLVRQESHQTDA